MTRILIFIIISTCMVSCSFEKKSTPDSLCIEFYNLNKGNDFDGLYNMHILGIRDRTEYDERTGKLERIPTCIGIYDNNSHICLPVFRQGANLKEQKLFFKRLCKEDSLYLVQKYNINYYDSNLFNYYVREVNSIFEKYDRIRVPNELTSNNIEIMGSENFIQFILYKNEEKRKNYSCYYIKDTILLEENFRKYFKKTEKLDNNWYYDIKN